MKDLTFYKDLYIVLILTAAVLLHTAAAACGFFIKNSKISKILNTGLTSANILLHLFLIVLMMYKGISLDEAVFVIMISIFFHTFLYFLHYTAVGIKEKRKLRKAQEKLPVKDGGVTADDI